MIAVSRVQVDGFQQLYLFKSEVTRVYDGDTITVVMDLSFKISMEASIRISGIDTPELRGSPPEEKRLARIARDRMKELCGKQVWVESMNGGKKDKYGRVLGRVYTMDGEDIADIMIKEGHAIEYGGKKKTHVWA